MAGGNLHGGHHLCRGHPLWVTGQVVRRGVAANWFWWSFLLSGMMTVFFFARMWRRAEIITDVELVELRYAGKPAAFLRGFRALYFGILINCIILGWVNLAMEKILGISLNIPKFWAVVICMVITAIYTSISGLWGVLWTDLVQFILKMGMLILLAFYAVRAVGGMGALKTKLAAVDVARGAAVGGTGSILSFVPGLAFTLDAGDDLPRLHRRLLVVGLVSGSGTGWRRLCGATHLLRQG